MASFFISPQKFGPHAQQKHVRRFLSFHQVIDLNNRRNIQSLPKKVTIFATSSKDKVTVRSVYVVI